MYCSAQPSLFSHIVRNDVFNNCLLLSNDINRLLCSLVVVDGLNDVDKRYVYIS